MITASYRFYVLFVLLFIEYTLCQALYYISFGPYNSLGARNLSSNLIDGETRSHSISVIFLRPHDTMRLMF